jgi:hypothetical protein
MYTEKTRRKNEKERKGEEKEKRSIRRVMYDLV